MLPFYFYNLFILVVFLTAVKETYLTYIVYDVFMFVSLVTVRVLFCLLSLFSEDFKINEKPNFFQN